MSLQPVVRPVHALRPRPSRRWAWLLVAAQMMQLLLEYLALRFAVDGEGRWVVTTAETFPAWWLLLYLAVGSFSLACTAAFAASLIRERRDAGRLVWHSEGVNGSDVLYLLAWLQALNSVMTFLYAFVLPDPLFSPGTVGSVLESLSLQVFVLAVGALLFWGRWAEIGFVRPRQPVRMMVFLLGSTAFILFVLDALVTYPVADWLSLSLESEREEAIRAEIQHAKNHDWLSAAFSVAMIGVFVPISEEMLFRGVIQTYLVRRWGAFWGIALASLWFALIHVDVAMFAPLFAIGAMLGWIRHRYQSIWGAVALHSVNNLVSALHHIW